MAGFKDMGRFSDTLDFFLSVLHNLLVVCVFWWRVWERVGVLGGIMRTARFGSNGSSCEDCQ